MKKLNLKNALNKTILCVLMSSVLTPNLGHGGEGGQSGGGGFVLTCAEHDKKPLKQNLMLTDVRFLDLWLAENGRGPFRKSGAQTILQSTEPVSVQITKIIDKARKSNPSYAALLASTVKHIMAERIEYSPRNYKIVANNDTDVSSIPQNCQMAGLGRYSDIEDYLEVDKFYFELLSPTDQAAFILHEAIYLIKRRYERNTTSSRTTQKEVGLLFSNTDLNGGYLNGSSHVYHCTSGKLPTFSMTETKKSFYADYFIGIKNEKVILSINTILQEFYGKPGDDNYAGLQAQHLELGELNPQFENTRTPTLETVKEFRSKGPIMFKGFSITVNSQLLQDVNCKRIK